VGIGSQFCELPYRDPLDGFTSPFEHLAFKTTRQSVIKKPRRETGRLLLKLYCADLFCGAGGSSSGLIEAALELDFELELIAINHWSVAIATHSENYPWAKHICARIEEIRPRDVVPRGRLHLLVASPECTFHSIARGGRPIEDQKRVPAWGVIQWAQELYIENIIIENVPEFVRWGPLGANGKPLKSKTGETYRAFLQALRSLGYRVAEQVICCADHGDATTRKRLFIVATRKGVPSWPMPSHGPREKVSLQSSLFQSTHLKPWRPAREIIDWQLKGTNIFARKKPLAEKTLKRIAAGMEKINGLDIEPFLIMFYGTNKTRSIEQPLPTVTANGQHIGLCEPFLLSQASGGAPRPIGEPVPTSCAKGAVQIVEPFLIPFFSERDGQQPRTRAIDEPVPTVTGHGAGGVVEPFLVPQFSEHNARSVERPLNTVTTTSRGIGLVEPFLVAAGGPEGKGRNPKSVDDPLDTVLTENHDALVQPFVIAVNHGDGSASSQDRCRPVDEPMPTLTCKNGFGVVEPFLLPHQHGNDTEQNVRSVGQPMPTVTATSSDMFLVEPYVSKYYGTGASQPVSEPLDTVTTKDRFGLVEPYLIPVGDNRYLGIRFRMLQPHELAAAQGFAKHYKFHGNKSTQVKQIGNAVPHYTAKALCRERLQQYVGRDNKESPHRKGA
jgi:DNA (cytosine-5)-methyltransferase 1